MDTIKNIESRRSIKHYDPDHIISEDDLNELIRLTKLTPSSLNMQNYRLVVIRDKDIRERIKKASYDQEQITSSSVLFIMCADLKSHLADPSLYWGHAPKEVQKILAPMAKNFYSGNDQLIRDEAIRSSSLAGMTLMLSANAIGYASCPMVGFDYKKVSEIINLPSDHIISFIIAVGKATKPAWDRGPRLPDETVVIKEKFK